MFPHHFYLGLLLVGVVVWIVADDYRDIEPVYVAVGSTVSIFSFVTLWGTTYPLLGAVGSLIGLIIATLAVATRKVWTDRGNVQYGWHCRLCIVLGLLVAWDDGLEHAFGFTTPLDWLWIEFIYPFVQQLPQTIGVVVSLAY